MFVATIGDSQYWRFWCFLDSKGNIGSIASHCWV